MRPCKPSLPPAYPERDQLLEYFAVPGRRGIYVLGVYEWRITLVSQQARAINLVHALFLNGSLRRERHLVVIGGGPSGLTAAAAAATLGARVTVLERNAQLMSVLRGNLTRWLHPHLYQWPDPLWGEEDAGLPVLDWSGNSVNAVVGTLQTEWEKVRNEHRVREFRNVRNLDFDPASLELSWEDGVGRYTDRGDVVVLAVGFGTEFKGPTGNESTTYWENDNFSRNSPRPDKQRNRFFVSGNGDGGVIDVLRLRLRGFDHEKFFKEFFKGIDGAPLMSTLAEIDHDVRSRLSKEQKRKWRGEPPEEDWKWLTERYLALQVDRLDDAIKDRLRDDTEVVLNGVMAGPISPNAFPVNRLLLSRFFRPGREWHVTYRAGRFAIPPRSTSGEYEIPDAHPEGKTFHEVVLRRGPPEPDKADPPSDATTTGNLAGILKMSVEGMLELAGDWRGTNVHDFTREPRWGAGRGGPRIWDEPATRRLDDLRDALERIETPFELMGVLFRVCDAKASELEEFLSTTLGNQTLIDLRVRARTVVAGLAKRITPEKAAELASFVAAEAKHVEPWKICRALADVVDDECHDQFLMAASENGKRSPVPIFPLDVIPIAEHSKDFRDKIKLKNDDRSSQPFTGALHAVLTPLSVDSVQLVFHKNVDLVIDPAARLAAGSPVGTRDLRWGSGPDPSSGDFFGVEPLDHARHSEAVGALARLAIAKRAEVLLMPEFVFIESMLGDLETCSTDLRVIVAGSHHYTEASRDVLSRHRTVVLLREARVDQHKLCHARYDVPGSRSPRRESIALGNAPLVVHFGMLGGSLVTLSEGDLEVADTRLDLLRPLLLLVPSTATPDKKRLGSRAETYADKLRALVIGIHMDERSVQAYFAIPSDPVKLLQADVRPPMLAWTTLDGPVDSETLASKP